MKIYYLGNQVAGLVGKLTVESMGHKIVSTPNGCDIMLSVHYRKILSNEVLKIPKIASINIHPYLYAYKGADPIGRAINENNWKASVGCHIMTDIVDSGEVVVEFFKDVIASNNRAEIYNQLYPLYSEVIKQSLALLEIRYIRSHNYDDLILGCDVGI
jgi:methionyl-tRNA formyltransferase